MAETLQSVDLALLAWLRPWRSPELDIAMRWISAGGGAGAVWLMLGIAGLLMRRHRAAAWRVFLIVMLAYILVDAVVKPAFARSRPSPQATSPPRHLPPLPRSFSFPSGHATSTFGAAVAVSRMWPQTRVLWWTLAVLVGYSRIYLGHHYPLDVLGGAVLGIAVAFWVLGGRHPATYASTLPRPVPAGLVIRP
jgi:undecaprenyl-diphosphatase